MDSNNNSNSYSYSNSNSNSNSSSTAASRRRSFVDRVISILSGPTPTVCLAGPSPFSKASFVDELTDAVLGSVFGRVVVLTPHLETQPLPAALAAALDAAGLGPAFTTHPPNLRSPSSPPSPSPSHGHGHASSGSLPMVTEPTAAHEPPILFVVHPMPRPYLASALLLQSMFPPPHGLVFVNTASSLADCPCPSFVPPEFKSSLAMFSSSDPADGDDPEALHAVGLPDLDPFVSPYGGHLLLCGVVGALVESPEDMWALLNGLRGRSHAMDAVAWVSRWVVDSLDPVERALAKLVASVWPSASSLLLLDDVVQLLVALGVKQAAVHRAARTLANHSLFTISAAGAFQGHDILASAVASALAMPDNATLVLNAALIAVSGRTGLSPHVKTMLAKLLITITAESDPLDAAAVDALLDSAVSAGLCTDIEANVVARFLDAGAPDLAARLLLSYPFLLSQVHAASYSGLTYSAFVSLVRSVAAHVPALDGLVRVLCAGREHLMKDPQSLPTELVARLGGPGVDPVILPLLRAAMTAPGPSIVPLESIVEAAGAPISFSLPRQISKSAVTPLPGGYAVAFDTQGRGHVFDVTSGAVLQTLTTPGPPSKSTRSNAFQHVVFGPVRSVLCCPQTPCPELIVWTRLGKVFGWSSVQPPPNAEAPAALFDPAGWSFDVPLGDTSVLGGLVPLGDTAILSWTTDGILTAWDMGCSCAAALVGPTPESPRFSALASITVPLGGGYGSTLLGVAATGPFSIVAYTEASILVWDLATDVVHQVRRPATSPRILGLAVTGAGGRLLAWTSANTLDLYDSSALDAQPTMLPFQSSLPGVANAVSVVAVNANAGRVIVLLRPAELVLVDTTVPKICAQNVLMHTHSIDGMAVLWNPARKKPDIITWGSSSTLQLWQPNCESNSPGGCLPVILEGHDDIVKGVAILDATRFVSWTPNQTLCVWNADESRVRATVPAEGVVSLTVRRPDAHKLLRGMVVWGWALGASPLVYPAKTSAWTGCGVQVLCTDGIDGAILSMTAAHGSAPYTLPWIFAFCKGGDIAVWSPQDNWYCGAAPVILKGHTADVLGLTTLPGLVARPDHRPACVSWSAGSALCVWGSSPDTHQRLDCPSGSVVVSVVVLCTAVATLPLLVSGSSDGNLRVWSSSDPDPAVYLPTPVQTVTGHSRGIRGLIPLGRSLGLVSWSSDGTLCVWLVDPSSHLLAEAPAHAFTMPDRFVTGSMVAWDDGTPSVVAWGVDTLHAWSPTLGPDSQSWVFPSSPSLSVDLSSSLASTMRIRWAPPSSPIHLSIGSLNVTCSTTGTLSGTAVTATVPPILVAARDPPPTASSPTAPILARDPRLVLELPVELLIYGVLRYLDHADTMALALTCQATWNVLGRQSFSEWAWKLVGRSEHATATAAATSTAATAAAASTVAAAAT